MWRGNVWRKSSNLSWSWFSKGPNNPRVNGVAFLTGTDCSNEKFTQSTLNKPEPVLILLVVWLRFNSSSDPPRKFSDQIKKYSLSAEIPLRWFIKRTNELDLHISVIIKHQPQLFLNNNTCGKTWTRALKGVIIGSNWALHWIWEAPPTLNNLSVFHELCDALQRVNGITNYLGGLAGLPLCL